jgi:hypothetical protein
MFLWKRSISFVRLLRCLVYFLVLTFTTPISQVPFDVGRRRYVPLTPTTLISSSLANKNLIGCNTLTFNNKSRNLWIEILNFIWRQLHWADCLRLAQSSSLRGSTERGRTPPTLFHIQSVQLKNGPLTKQWIFQVRCYWQWFCWYDIILIHVQELARRGENRSWLSVSVESVDSECRF